MSECWEWRGNRSAGGYGIKTRAGKKSYTHRLAYAWAFGAIPKGLFVLHRCDNPPCVNPSHLFLGTQADNMRDKTEKGRDGRLPKKLSEDQISEVRERGKSKRWGVQAELAREFGVSPSTVHNIIRQKNVYEL